MTAGHGLWRNLVTMREKAFALESRPLQAASSNQQAHLKVMDGGVSDERCDGRLA